MSTITATNLHGDTIRKTGGSLGVDIRVKNTSVYESDGGTSVTQNLVQALTKMHCVVNQSSTQAITDSFNLSSISDGGTAKTTHTMTNAMSNITYTISGSCESTSSGHGAVHNEDLSVTRTTTIFGVYIVRNDGSLSDTVVMTVIHGDLA